MESMVIDGRVYVSHACWAFGDYGGAGSLGLANIRYIAEQCDGHVISAGMGDLRHASEGCPYGLGEDTLAEIKLERPWAIHAFGHWSSEQIWVRKAIACRLSSHGFRGETWIERMDSYPSLDDELISEIEMEWESEAWDSWLRDDLLRTMADDDRDEAKLMGPDVLFECYRAAMDDCNEYPTPEYSGVHVDVDRIAESFADHVADAVASLYTP